MNNSRIVNELIEKANEWSYEEYNYKKNGYTREQLYSQKLAELIVLECARVVKASSPQGMIGVNAIRIHFGIEP
jgi:hypothetical protein